MEEQLSEPLVVQASAYEVCNRMRTPLHMSKTLETC